VGELDVEKRDMQTIAKTAMRGRKGEEGKGLKGIAFEE